MAWFAAWYEEAENTGMRLANAVVVATADAEGNPSARFVNLNTYDERGFVFYTNVGSRKGRELMARPRAALCFYWKELSRQVRIEGDVEMVASAQADAYFATRPLLARIAAAASDQSRPLESRAALDERVRQLQERHAAGDVPRPDYWVGFRVRPSAMEFWISGANRLHNRWLFTRSGEGAPWQMTRLYP